MAEIFNFLGFDERKKEIKWTTKIWGGGVPEIFGRTTKMKTFKKGVKSLADTFA